MPRIVAYGSSKGGVRQITQGLAVEWARVGIRVNGIEPGWFRTELTEPLFHDEAWVAKITNRIPMGQAGAPEDLAGTVVFLASPMSDYIPGARSEERRVGKEWVRTFRSRWSRDP